MPRSSTTFEPGHKKVGGKKKGINYADWIRDFLQQDEELAAEDFAKLTPKDRWQVRQGMSKYAAPALSSVDLSANVNTEDDALSVIKGMAETSH